MTTHDTLADEFLSARRARWTRRLITMGMPLWRAQQSAARLATGSDWRALVRDLFGAAVLAVSLATSAVAMFLL